MKRRRFLKIFGGIFGILASPIVLAKEKNPEFKWWKSNVIDIKKPILDKNGHFYFLEETGNRVYLGMGGNPNIAITDVPIGSLARDQMTGQCYMFRGKKWGNWCTIE